MSYQIHNSESHLQEWRGIDAEKSRELEETVEFLEEQIESLRQGLCHKSHELQEIKQELRYTNYELCAAHELYAAISAKLLTVDEAKELAKNLLVSEKLIKDVLVELLSAISSKLLTVDEAKELATNLLASEKLIKNVLVELLSAIWIS